MEFVKKKKKEKKGKKLDHLKKKSVRPLRKKT